MSHTGAPWPDPYAAPGVAAPLPGPGPAGPPPLYGMPPGWAPSPPSRAGLAARWVVGGLALVVGLVLCGFGVSLLWYDAWLDENGVRVDATVVEVTWESTVVSYPVEGRGTVEGELYFSDAAVGDVVEVEYDPEDPTYVRPVDSPEDTVLGGLLLGAGVLSLLVTVGSWWWAVAAGRTRERVLAVEAARSWYGAAPYSYPAPPPAAYAPRHGPYAPPQTSYAPQQAPYAQPPAPYTPPQAPYAPPHATHAPPHAPGTPPAAAGEPAPSPPRWAPPSG
jgi:hypothetical protein